MTKICIRCGGAIERDREWEDRSGAGQIWGCKGCELFLVYIREELRLWSYKRVTGHDGIGGVSIIPEGCLLVVEGKR